MKLLVGCWQTALVSRTYEIMNATDVPSRVPFFTLIFQPFFAVIFRVRFKPVEFFTLTEQKRSRQ